jgi:hypothetical protein
MREVFKEAGDKIVNRARETAIHPSEGTGCLDRRNNRAHTTLCESVRRSTLPSSYDSLARRICRKRSSRDCSACAELFFKDFQRDGMRDEHLHYEALRETLTARLAHKEASRS